MPIGSQLPIDTFASAEDMANEIFGSGITVVSATYSGDDASSGIYTNGDLISNEATPGDSGVILSTGNAIDFSSATGTTVTNTSGSTSTNTAGVNGDDDFDTLAGSFTQDAAILEVEFIPLGDTITIDFVLSSEEYPEFINSVYNDVVGVWVNGAEATVSIGDGSASIGNINGGQTQNIYNDNTGNQYNTEMDGFTVTLTFVAPVTPGVTNTLKIGVADVGDNSYDTNLLIAGGSVQSTIVARDDAVEMATNKDRILDVLDNDTSTGGTLTVTHINGQVVSVGSTITLATGQSITLTANGDFLIESDGNAETVYFNYSIEDTSGNTDTAIVEITQSPCFVEGSLIETPSGLVPVEELHIGMEVCTRDNGTMPIRWIGHSSTEGTGTLAPICIQAGQFGAAQDLWVSPQHRILLQGYLAELLYGELEVLVKAKDLINDQTVRQIPRQTVTYYHMMFDSHQIIYANGVATESYLPGPATLPGFSDDIYSEIISLFPDLAHDYGSYGQAARPILKGREAMPLISHLMQAA
jgi:hypothetical protein